MLDPAEGNLGFAESSAGRCNQKDEEQSSDLVDLLSAVLRLFASASVANVRQVS